MAQLAAAEAQLGDADSRAVAQLEALTAMHAAQLADAQRRAHGAGAFVTVEITDAAPHWMSGNLVELCTPARAPRIRIPVASA